MKLLLEVTLDPRRPVLPDRRSRSGWRISREVRATRVCGVGKLYIHCDMTFQAERKIKVGVRGDAVRWRRSRRWRRCGVEGVCQRCSVAGK